MGGLFTACQYACWLVDSLKERSKYAWIDCRKLIGELFVVTG